jgi:hypothetical protein
VAPRSGQARRSAVNVNWSSIGEGPPTSKIAIRVPSGWEYARLAVLYNLLDVMPAWFVGPVKHRGTRWRPGSGGRMGVKKVIIPETLHCASR